MTKTQAAAFIMARAAQLNCRVAGMVADNQAREHRGESPAWTALEFADVDREYQDLDRDALITLFNESQP